MNIIDICNTFYKLAAKIEITKTDDSSKVGVEEAREVLYWYLKKYYKEYDNILDIIGDKTKFNLIDYKTDKYGDKFVFELIPRANKRTTITSGEFDKEYYNYKEPSNSIPEIPADSSLAYRGMSYPEWEQILRTGFVKSKGGYNLGSSQAGLTFFADEPGSAVYYANGFAPWVFKISHNKPGVIIGVDKAALKTDKDMPNAVMEGELVSKDPLAINVIKKVWFMIETERRKGVKYELTKTKHPSAQENKSLWKVDTTMFGSMSPSFSIIDVTNRYIRQV